VFVQWLTNATDFTSMMSDKNL